MPKKDFSTKLKILLSNFSTYFTKKKKIKIETKIVFRKFSMETPSKPPQKPRKMVFDAKTQILPGVRVVGVV